MNDPSQFSREMSRLAAGDEAAATALFDRYARRLIGLARARLDDRLKKKVDPEDVIQSVFRTFFRRHGDRQFELNNWDGLWALLAEITWRKCGKQWQQYSAEKRDMRRESPLAGNDARDRWDPPALQATPDEAVALTDLLAKLFEGRTPRDAQVVEMRLQGHTVPEIALAVDCTERTVFRVLGGARHDLERLLSNSAEHL